MFPGVNFTHLAGKSRAELRSIIDAVGRPQSESNLPIRTPQSHVDSTASGINQQGELFKEEEDDDELTPLSEDSEPPDEGQWDETFENPETVATDDINAIGLATDKQARSYLGISSMSAVFRAIFRLYPPTKEFTAQRAQACASVLAAPQLSVSMPGGVAMNVDLEPRYIDFFFNHFHAVTPLVDEIDFREKYASKIRNDSSWNGLLYMVLCLGSIAAGAENLHEMYYHKARSHINLDSLGSGNIYSLQALCLLGGQYLHYRNSPNMAYSILGAAHRVAIALGLHREPRKQQSMDPEDLRRAETRRRTWWSLVCLDSWACMTQGRPNCGRWDASAMDTALPSALDGDYYIAAALNASARFSLVCEGIQHRFAKLGRLNKQDISVLDKELRDWFQTLPSFLQQADTTAHPRLQVARDYLLTRYHNARLVLARCLMLLLAQDKRKRVQEANLDQRHSVEACCVVAAEAIDAIVLHWSPTRPQVWNSGWYLFQACTVPLLAMSMERNTHTTSSSKEFASWQESLAKALRAFADMRPLMRTSDRSPDIVSAMYDGLTLEADGVTRTPSATDDSLDLFGWCDDEQLPDMDWSMFLGESLPQEDLPIP